MIEERAAALFDSHYERLYRLARRLTSSREDALDLVQETFLRAASADSAVPVGADAAEAWLVRVLVNLQRDVWRKDRVRARHRAQAAPVESIGSPEAALLAGAVVWRAMSALAPRRRAIVVMHELEDVPVREIARALGLRPVTVRWHLFRGRQELKRALGAPGRTT